MGEPIDKAGVDEVQRSRAFNAAEVILMYAKYLQRMDPANIHATTRNDLLRALSAIERVVWAGLQDEDDDQYGRNRDFQPEGGC